MNAKEFRLDFFIAIAALLISAVSAFALLYQTRVIGDQYAATIWPYLTANSTFNTTGVSFSVANEGVGPALIQSAQLFVDGKPVAGWQQYFDKLRQDPTIRAYFVQLAAEVRAGKHPGSVTTANLAPTQAIRPGDTRTILDINLQDIPVAQLVSHRIDVNVCYCSLNKSCWMLKTSADKVPSAAQAVAHCPPPTSIDAPRSMFTSPSGPQRRKSP